MVYKNFHQSRTCSLNGIRTADRNVANWGAKIANVGIVKPRYSQHKTTHKEVIMNKRESVLALLDKDKSQAVIPAAFFIHFDKAFHRGQAAVEKHLEYFRYTGMDVVKIQYEDTFPHLPEIQ
jgi:hypothetical protein